MENVLLYLHERLGGYVPKIPSPLKNNLVLNAWDEEILGE
jgi:hypothetical protein